MAPIRHRCSNCRQERARLRRVGINLPVINRRRQQLSQRPLTEDDRICESCYLGNRFRAGADLEANPNVVVAGVEAEMNLEVDENGIVLPAGAVMPVDEDVAPDVVDEVEAIDGVGEFEPKFPPVDENPIEQNDGVVEENMQQVDFIWRGLEGEFPMDVDRERLGWGSTQGAQQITGVEDQEAQNGDSTATAGSSITTSMIPNQSETTVTRSQHTLVKKDESYSPSGGSDPSSDDTGDRPVGERMSNENRPRLSNVELHVKSVTGSEDCCLICGPNSKGLPLARSRIPKSAQIDLWITEKIYLPGSCRSCPQHISTNTFTDDSKMAIRNLHNLENILLTTEEAMSLLHHVTDVAAKPKMDFGVKAFTTDDDYLEFTGLTITHFDDLYTEIGTHFYKNKSEDIRRTALALFLCKMKTGCSQTFLSKLFKIPRSTVGRYQQKILKVLVEKFVPKYLGYSHMSREEYIKSCHTEFARTITAAEDSQAIAILDGTYFYCQKSANYKLQRRLYSMHKTRPLAKAMMVVAPNGYILEVECMYMADGKNNDASIFKHMAGERGFPLFFKVGDIIIWDRGFRDCSKLAKELGLKVMMPHFLEKKVKQHSTEEANESRLVTKLRWVVESVNGRLKRKWKFLDGKIENTYLDSLQDYVRVGCALLNKYFPPLVTDKPEDAGIAKKMLERSKQSNLLMEAVEKKKIAPARQKSKYAKLEASSLENFPRLRIEDLRKVTFGVYQIKQAASYTAEHLDEDGDYELSYLKSHVLGVDQEVISVHMQSRHQQSSKYYVWIHYTPNGEDVHSINGWYCSCRSGTRVVGCCAHACAVMWYLGYGRHVANLTLPGQNTGHQLLDAAEVKTSRNEDD